MKRISTCAIILNSNLSNNTETETYFDENKKVTRIFNINSKEVLELYSYIDDGRRVGLFVLANADKSLVGLKFKNCEIKEITVSEMSSLLLETYGAYEVPIFHKKITSLPITTVTSTNTTSKPQPINDISLTILEEVDSYGVTSTLFFKSIKLFKSVDLYPCYSINYIFENGKPKRGGYSSVLDYPHALGINECKFDITEEEKQNFPTWFEQHKDFAFANDTNEQFQKALRTYNLSYYIGFKELEFIMLYTILEMLFASERTEISYQIARGTALLLSTNTDEFKSTYKFMKKLYNARSKYVHEGNSIERKNLFELREIVRKVILKLIEMEYHQKDKTFKELQEKILCAGVEKL